MPLYDDGTDPRSIKKIRDARVDAFIAQGDLNTLEVLARELERRIPHAYESADPRRQRHEQRLARVLERISELRRRRPAASRHHRMVPQHDRTADQEVEA